MTRWKVVLWTSLAALALAVVGSSFGPSVAAQVRAALVRDVDNPARQAVVIKNYTTTSIFETVYTVPAGKILVVEHMNCSALGTSLYAGLFVGPLTHQNIVYSVPVISTDSGVLVADGSTRLYLNGGTDLNLRVFTTNGTTCIVSGYTVDAS